MILKCGIIVIYERSTAMDDKEKKTLPEQPVDEKPESSPGVSAEPSAHTWVDDMKQELEDYIEDQGIYIRQ